MDYKILWSLGPLFTSIVSCMRYNKTIMYLHSKVIILITYIVIVLYYIRLLLAVLVYVLWVPTMLV